MRGAFPQQDSDPVHGFGWRWRWRWRWRWWWWWRCAGFAQLPANLIAQRQQPAVVGNLLQALIDVHQTGFVSANALRVQCPRQRLVGLRAASLGLGAQASLLDLAVFFGQGLLAGRIFLGLAFLLFPHLALESQQRGMVGHGHQALLNMHQSPVQRAFLPGAPRLLQKLLGLQFRLQPLFFLRLPGSGSVDLSVDVLAQRQQLGMVGREWQSLLNQGATVLQRAGLQPLAGLGD